MQGSVACGGQRTTYATHITTTKSWMASPTNIPTAWDGAVVSVISGIATKRTVHVVTAANRLASTWSVMRAAADTTLCLCSHYCPCPLPLILQQFTLHSYRSRRPAASRVARCHSVSFHERAPTGWLSLATQRRVGTQGAAAVPMQAPAISTHQQTTWMSHPVTCTPHQTWICAAGTRAVG